MSKRISRDQTQHFVGPDIAKTCEIEPGQEVVFDTVDCYSGAICNSSQKFNLTAEILEQVTGLNAVTGPVAVAGAEPGDVLAVSVLDIHVGKVEGRAITAIFPDFGGMCNPFSLIQEMGPDTKVCQVKDGDVEFPLGDRIIKLPLRPMIGTIWTAPAQERRAAYIYDAHNCGNVDCPDLGPGATLYLPVSVPGGMLSIGDVHACQGDGEITGQALETAAEVRVRVDLIKGPGSKHVACPQIELPDSIGSIGCHFGRPLGDNVKAAFQDMILRLHKHYGFSRIDAYELLGQVARIRVHQALDNWNAVSVSIEKKYLQ